MCPADPVTDELSQLRARGDEGSLDQATKLEREYEKGLARESDEAIRAAGYDPKELRAEHKTGTKAKPKAKAKAKAGGGGDGDGDGSNGNGGGD